jgi:hypothetical protein
MAKTSTLIILVNSLTKGEKRYFKLNSSLQEGSKDYLTLFNLMEDHHDPREIREAYSKMRPNSSFEVASKYLYKVITDCLLNLRSDQNIVNKLVNALLKTNILFEKSLYEEGFRQLSKIIDAAEKYELHWMMLWACRLELFHLGNLNFYSLSETELEQKHLKISELIRQTGNSHQHTSLYESLRHRLLYKGNVRTAKQKEELTDLLVSEVNIVSNSRGENINSQITHLLFQAYYFITVSNYQAALQTFYELNELLEENQFMWADSPVDYLNTLEGILDSLHTIRRYKEMTFFLEKIRSIQMPALYLEVMAQRVLFKYEVVAFLDTGHFEQAEKIKNKYEDALVKKLHLLDVSKQADVYLYIALIYIGMNNMNQANNYLDKVLLQNKLFYSLPVYRTFRLVNLIVHYELHNYDYLKYETRSIKRTLDTVTNTSYALERLIFKFIESPELLQSSKSRAAFLKKLQQDFFHIKEDKYSIQLLKVFDFLTWIEAKLGKKNFPSLLKEKTLS